MESSLGDGIFNGTLYLDSDGSIAVGTDSNVQVAQAGEFRTLEYSQRLSANCRCALAVRSHSEGRSLLGACAEGGASAISRPSDQIVPGALADLVELDGDHANSQGLAGDGILDAWIVAEGRGMVRTVWSAGRKLVRAEFISEEMKSRASIARSTDFIEMQFEQPRHGCDVPRELC